jgi:AraC-like DNA-binding protein
LDALTTILGSLRLRSAVFARAELGRGWAVSTRGIPGAGIFHAVVSGSAMARLDDGKKAAFVSLSAGDVVLFPHGDPHVMAESPAASPRSIRDLVLPRPAGAPDDGVADVRAGLGPARTILLCGRIDFDRLAPHPLLGQLPRMLPVLGSDAVIGRWLGPTVALMAAEAAGDAPGRSLLVTRLSDVLVVQALRAHIAAASQAPTGWLRALRDPHVERALTLLHAEPKHEWTVDALSVRVGLSRAALYQRFTELVGEPPARYLARWRMHLATRQLVEGQRSVAEIAGDVGYQTEAAFSRAFKRIVGTSPAAYRRASVPPAAASA